MRLRKDLPLNDVPRSHIRYAAAPLHHTNHQGPSIHELPDTDGEITGRYSIRLRLKADRISWEHGKQAGHTVSLPSAMEWKDK